jgi:outer membrane protein assembly factor BamB
LVTQVKGPVPPLNDHPGVLSSPAVADGVVYVGSDDVKIYALDASSGTRLWFFRTGRPVDHSSPAVANGMVYIASGPTIFAFDLPHTPEISRPVPSTLRPDRGLRILELS